MERELPLNTVEFDQQQIKQVVNNNFSEIIKYLIDTNPFFPHVCGNASVLLEDKIEDELKIDIRFCEGTRYDNKRKHFCDYHSWLEYGDLIIDPTDFQFFIYDTSPLPSTPNFPKETEPHKRENYFNYLFNLVAGDQTKTDFFISELKRCFGCKIFYSKSDPRYLYKDCFNDT